MLRDFFYSPFCKPPINQGFNKVRTIKRGGYAILVFRRIKENLIINNVYYLHNIKEAAV